MSDHAIQVVAEGGELVLRLVCTAPVGAPCRRRSPEGYGSKDDDCWAEEWASEAGWESVFAMEDGVWASVPVGISYDDGVDVTPAPPEKGAP